MALLELLSDNPVLRLLQFALLVTALLSVFFVLFTTRDSLLRSTSFWFQFFAIVLVAALPIVGFLLYLLLRPARTLKERETEAILHSIQQSLGAKNAVSRKESKKKDPRADESIEASDA
jgi:hypothetical protein